MFIWADSSTHCTGQIWTAVVIAFIEGKAFGLNGVVTCCRTVVGQAGWGSCFVSSMNQLWFSAGEMVLPWEATEKLLFLSLTKPYSAADEGRFALMWVTYTHSNGLKNVVIKYTGHARALGEPVYKSTDPNTRCGRTDNPPRAWNYLSVLWRWMESGKVGLGSG